jgi:hypothetical protein
VRQRLQLSQFDDRPNGEKAWRIAAAGRWRPAARR